MVMKPEPLLAAIARGRARGHRICCRPAGTPLTQARVRELAHAAAPRARVRSLRGHRRARRSSSAIDEQISIGDYVLSGGELGALVIIDAVARLRARRARRGDVASTTSRTRAGLLEYPQYTRPLELDGARRARRC